MDRGRRAEPYSSATIWTREIARNLAGHLSRVSRAHSCVDTKSPKSTRLPQFHHQKRCPTSPLKTRQPLLTIPRNPSSAEQELDCRGLGGNSAREETNGASELINNERNNHFRHGVRNHDTKAVGTSLQPQHDDSDTEVEVNQEVQDRHVRIPAVKGPAKQHHLGRVNAVLNDMDHDCPPILPPQKNRLGHDYCKRQEQKKIWQENQALIKRLQSTKATLNSKEWMKDDKWTQDFLKKQEKRRSALQQELRRAQVSPHVILRSKPLKSLYPQSLKSMHHESQPDKILDVTWTPTNADVAGAPSIRKPSLLGSKGRVLAESQEPYGGTVLPVSAANHRLRKTKPLLSTSSSSDDIANVIFAESTAIDAPGNTMGDDQAASIPDNEIVNVRFTFSRGRSRESGMIDQSAQPQSLEIDESVRGMMNLSGAFSPGVELESALNEVALDEPEIINQCSSDQTSHTVDIMVDEVPVEADSSQQSEQDLHADGSQEHIFGIPGVTTAVKNAIETVLPSSDTTEENDSHIDEPGRTSPEDAADISHDIHQELSTLADFERGEDVEYQEAEAEKSDVEAIDKPVDTTERISPPVVEQERVEPDDEEEEDYDQDNFDDDPALPDMDSYGAPPEQSEDKGEASGYGSEFEEEVAVLTIPHSEIPTDNQDQGKLDEEDASYSIDDFAE